MTQQLTLCQLLCVSVDNLSGEDALHELLRS